MLAVRRSGITDALSVFKRAGLIEGTYGKVAFCDRAKLEKAAFECLAPFATNIGGCCPTNFVIASDCFLSSILVVSLSSVATRSGRRAIRG